MTLLLHVHSGYPSYEEAGIQWDSADWDAFKFARALKGEPIKGYASIKTVDGVWKKISAENPGPAFDIFGAWAAKVINTAGVKSAYAIPVPGSQCVKLDTDQKGRRLCNSIAKFHPGVIADEAFCWSEPMVPAHKGGPRRKSELMPKLKIWTTMPKDRPVILVDDVATLHGHMKACAQMMRDFGHEVVLGIAGAQTVHERPEHGMFNFPAIDLDAPEPDPFADWCL